MGRFVKYAIRAKMHERRQTKAGKKADHLEKIANASKNLFRKRLYKSQMLQEEINEKRSEIKQLIAIARMIQQFRNERRVKFHINKIIGKIGRLRTEERELRDELKENDTKIAELAIGKLTRGN